MRANVSFADAQARDPQAIADILAKLAGGSSKHRGATAAALSWRYEWMQQIGGRVQPIHSGLPRHVPRGISAVLLVGRIGAWSGSAYVSGVPSPVADAYLPAKPRTLASNALAVTIHDTRGRNPRLFEVIGGYWRRSSRGMTKGPTLPVLVLSDVAGPRESQHLEIFANGQPWYYGGFTETTAKAFDAAAEGAIFRWRNKPFRRMTRSEIQAVIGSGGPFTSAGVFDC